jgi:hypothetical protein
MERLGRRIAANGEYFEEVQKGELGRSFYSVDREMLHLHGTPCDFADLAEMSPGLKGRIVGLPAALYRRFGHRGERRG